MQTIMLLLGGFAIASAFTKHFIAKRMATWVLSKVSSKPQYVLIANMLVATFASMWITNVAAPVLCFSLLQPILRTLPSGHSFAKSLVLGWPPPAALASDCSVLPSPSRCQRCRSVRGITCPCVNCALAHFPSLCRLCNDGLAPPYATSAYPV